MFFSKKKNVIRWNFKGKQSSTSTVTLEITTIKQFKNSFFGIKNDPSSFSYVPNPMEVSKTSFEEENPE